MKIIYFYKITVFIILSLEKKEISKENRMWVKILAVYCNSIPIHIKIELEKLEKKIKRLERK